MKAYIIGLEHSYRGAPLEVALEEVGVAFERVPGVQLELTQRSIAGLVDQAGARVLLRRELTAGEAGCALAHRKACRRLIDNGDDVGIIFEDDARLDPVLWSPKLLDLIPTDVPTVLSLYSNTSWVVAGEFVAQSGEVQVWRTQNVPLNATAYILNLAAARLLTDEGTPVRYVADWPPHIASQIDFWITFPWLAPAATDVDSSLASGRATTRVSDAKDPSRKALRHLAAITHITWLRERSKYRNYRAYVEHEFRRILVLMVARHIRRTPEGLLRFPWGRRVRAPQRSR